MADVLDTNIDALFEVAVADGLVNGDTYGRFGDIVDDAGFAVVEFVGHALLYGTVDYDVHNIADAVLPEIHGHRDCAMLLETAAKGIASAGAKTV